MAKLTARSQHRPASSSSAGNGFRKDPRRGSGFSLVEIMIGMVIGMIGIIVIMQVFSLFEGQKRTTAGGGEAQNTGAIALSSISDDIRQSGYGFNLINLIGCSVTLRAGVTVNVLAPTVINSSSIPAGDANTDTLLVTYGNSDILPEGNSIVLPAIDSTHFSVQAYKSFNVGDYVIPTPLGRSCTAINPAILNQVTAVTNPTLTITPGVTNSVTPGLLFNLGKTITMHAYAVRNGNLTVCDYMVNDCGNAGNVAPLDSTVWVPVAGNIVSLRAQYGQDITNNEPSIVSANTGLLDGVVDIYSQQSPANSGASKDACDWLRIPSIRLALVARNTQYEKTNVTSAAPLWDGSTATNNSPSWAGSTAGAQANPIDLSQNPDGTANTNWQHYRYKTFETTLPLRNVTSSVGLGVASGC
ncbi:MAG: PilW family protein [Gallionella sp.]